MGSALDLENTAPIPSLNSINFGPASVSLSWLICREEQTEVSAY